MSKYISLGNRKMFRSGTSFVFALPNVVLKKNNAELGEDVEVLWDGEGDLLVRFKKKV